MRLFGVLLGSALLAGCASQTEGLICPGSDLRLGERAEMEIYLTAGDVHGLNSAVSVACPDDIVLIETKMATREERLAFWDRANSFERSREGIPVGHAIVSGDIRLSPDEILTLQIHSAEKLEPAFPPPRIATTLNLSPPERPE